MNFQPRPYQQAAIDASIAFFNGKQQCHAILILPTGSGKSVCISNIAMGLEGKTIVFQPSKEILEQNYAKFTSYGYRAGIYSASAGMKFIDQVTFATIGSVAKKHHLFREFKNIIVDECFPEGSLVDGKKIESIKVGDYVRSYNHATEQIELKKVVRLFKKEVNSVLLKIDISDGSSFLCTDNHPIYTKQIGYIPAIFLTLIDNLTLLKASIDEPKNNPLLLRVRHRNKKERARQKIKHILLSGVCYKGKRNKESKADSSLQLLSKRVYAYRQESRRISQKGQSLLFLGMRTDSAKEGIFGNWKKNKRVANFPKDALRAYEKQQPYVDTWRKRKNDRSYERSHFSFQRRQRTTYQTTDDIAFSNSLSNGISNRNRTRKTPFPISTKLLQSGFSFCRKANSNRSRWTIARSKEMEVFRPEKNRNIECVRVESVEVYQSGSRFQRAESCKKDYVYNIEVEDNHNYFVSNILVHNCHLCSAKGGMYKDFIQAIEGCKVLGLTATPYRLSSGMDGAMLKFLTRTRPRIFSDVLYLVQNDVLFNNGYLAKLEYYNFNVIDRKMLQLNSTGTDFTESSLRSYYKKIDFPKVTAYWAGRLLAKRKNLLVFCALIDDAMQAARLIPGAVVLTGETDKKSREKILSDFKANRIKCLLNVGVLTTGFDYPELECVLLARSTMSLSLYYQMIGRCMRPHAAKASGWVVDLGNNIPFFGKIETMKIVNNNGLYSVMNNGRHLTNVSFKK